ncbi:MAG: signal peptidase I [Dehalococcoidia bacterium]|nr:signal peptidase I [Dehalococcoidia bacterium]
MSVIRVAFAVALLAMSVAWLLLFRPTFLGGPASYVMVSGESMEPTLDSGDLVLLRQQGNYGNGDIVAFHVPEGEPGEGAIVIHRIVGGSPDEGFVMQGDNKDGPDSWQPTKDDVVGEMWFSVPGASRSLAVLHSPLLLAGLASGVAVFLVLIGGEEKNRPREVSPAKRPDRPRRLRLPPGLMLWLLLILTASLVVAAPASAAKLAVNGGTLQVFTFPGGLGPVPATVDIKPESLQKRSHGQAVTAFIELPSGFDVANIQVGSIRLCVGANPCADGVPPDGARGAKPKVGDADKDGIPDLKVTFDRAAVIALVESVIPPATVSFTISGIVNPPNRIFAGSDTVKVVDPERSAETAPEPTPTDEPTSTPTSQPMPTAEPTAVPEPTLEVTPEPTPTAEPTAAPEPTPEPTPVG